MPGTETISIGQIVLGTVTPLPCGTRWRVEEIDADTGWSARFPTHYSAVEILYQRWRQRVRIDARKMARHRCKAEIEMLTGLVEGAEQSERNALDQLQDACDAFEFALTIDDHFDRLEFLRDVVSGTHDDRDDGWTSFADFQREKRNA